MAIVLSLLAGALYGVGDFFGAMSTKRATVLQVIVGAHAVGLLGAIPASLLLADRFSFGALGIGACAGIFGGVGLMLLYRGLAVGPMFVIAPTTAISAAGVPALWDVANGGSLSRWAWIGVAVALLAILLVSTPEKSSSEPPPSARVIIEAILAGAGFGVLFIIFDMAPADTAPWPVVGARLMTVLPLGVVLVARTRRQRDPLSLALDKPVLLLIAAAGVADTLSNVLFIFAVGRGSLTVVSVLVSLYPIGTIVMARIFLAERMGPKQRVGLLFALAATGLIAAG